MGIKAGGISRLAGHVGAVTKLLSAAPGIGYTGIKAGSISRLDGKVGIVTGKLPRAAPSRPFNLPITPFDPQTGTHMPLGSTFVAQRFTLVKEESNYLVCMDSHGRHLLVAKPQLLQRSYFDGRTINLYPNGGAVTGDLYQIVYEYTSENTREATGSVVDEDDIVEIQKITPDYADGEKIDAIRMDTGIGDGVDAIYWQDMNTAGRCWAWDTEAEVGP